MTLDAAIDRVLTHVPEDISEPVKLVMKGYFLDGSLGVKVLAPRVIGRYIGEHGRAGEVVGSLLGLSGECVGNDAGFARKGPHNVGMLAIRAVENTMKPKGFKAGADMASCEGR